MIDYLDNLYRRYGIHRTRPDPSFMPLSPEEESSVLGTLADTGLHGLSYAGSVLDKTFGGRAVRGALGGKYGELASIIPFSDTLGITDEANSVSGRDLLEKGGFLGPNQEGFDWGDVGGMAAEIALDPSTYLSFGASALNKAGVAAEKAGTLGKTVAERIALGQGGHMGVGLPFMGNAATFDLSSLAGPAKAIGGYLASPITGPAQWINQAAGGVPGEALKSAGRSLRSMFDTSVAEQTSAMGQKLAPAILERTDEGLAANRLHLAEQIRRMGPEASTSKRLTYLVEDAKARAAGDPYAQLAWSAAGPGMREAAEREIAQQADLLGELQSMGSKTTELESMYGTPHMPRQPAYIEGEKQWYGAPTGKDVMDVNIPQQLQRDPIFDVPQGTFGFEELVKDPRISTTARTSLTNAEAAKIAHDQYKIVNPEYLKFEAGAKAANAAPSNFFNDLIGKEAAGSFMTDAEKELLGLGKTHYADPYAHAAKTTDFLGTLHPDRLPVSAGGKGTGYFEGRSSIADLESQYAEHAKFMGAADIGQNALAEAATTQALAGPGAMRVEDVVRGMNLAVSKKAGAQQAMLGAKMKDWVPAELGQALIHGQRAFQSPAQVKGIMKLVETVTGWFTKGVTRPFPAHHIRNATGAAWNNTILGVPPGASGYGHARGMLSGSQKAIPGIAATDFYKGRGLTDAEASIDLANRAFAHGVTGSNFYTHTGAGADTGQDIIRRIPGMVPSEGVTGIFKAGKEGAKGKGLAGLVTGPMEAGRVAGNEIEDTMRMAAFIEMTKQGYRPEIAAAKIKAAHFDYKDLTRWEQEWARPLAPFYVFARKNLPLQLKRIMEEPGGFTGTAIKGSANLREACGEGFTPEYLGAGPTVPLGEEKGGIQQFLTQFGLPFEQPFDVIDPSSSMRTLERLGSQLNPLIKGPLEYVANKQLYSGRELDKLYSPTGNITLDQLMANLPTARLQSTVRGLSDDRKSVGARALNFLTGVKLSDVDMEKQRDLAARDLLRKELNSSQNVRSFQNYFVPKDLIGTLSPEEFLLMRLNQTVEKRAREAAALRRQQAGQTVAP